MNSYVEMTMVEKEQVRDDYFNQQSILFTLPAYISARGLVLAGNVKSCFVDWNNYLVFAPFLTIVIST